jgi:glycosyltransferase involved in cell wall biosynthesis
VLREYCEEWESETGATFIWKPFGINMNRFQYKPDVPSKYNFGFSGNLHEEHINDRKRVKEHIFKDRYLDFSWWHNLIHTRRFEPRYDGLNIYWGEWSHNALYPVRNRAPFGEQYVDLLNKCDMFLNTRSAMGIFNPRFWELMATKTLTVCPEGEYYGLLDHGRNCVMYNDLDEFDELLHYYADNDEERTAIIDQAYEEVQRYEWSILIDELLDEIA